MRQTKITTIKEMNKRKKKTLLWPNSVLKTKPPSQDFVYSKLLFLVNKKHNDVVLTKTEEHARRGKKQQRVMDGWFFGSSLTPSFPVPFCFSTSSSSSLSLEIFRKILKKKRVGLIKATKYNFRYRTCCSNLSVVFVFLWILYNTKRHSQHCIIFASLFFFLLLSLYRVKFWSCLLSCIPKNPSLISFLVFFCPQDFVSSKFSGFCLLWFIYLYQNL